MHVMIDSDLLLPLDPATLLMFRDFLETYVSLQSYTQTPNG